MYGDSCGRKGIGETPQCEARGGSPAARGKRSIFPERVRRTNKSINPKPFSKQFPTSKYFKINQITSSSS
nr:hypothetical protein [Ornithinibacillus halotolerans]